MTLAILTFVMKVGAKSVVRVNEHTWWSVDINLKMFLSLLIALLRVCSKFKIRTRKSSDIYPYMNIYV